MLDQDMVFIYLEWATKDMKTYTTVELKDRVVTQFKLEDSTAMWLVMSWLAKRHAEKYG